MKKLHLVVCLTVALCCTALGVFAEEATKAAAAFTTNAFVIPANDGKWHTVLTTTIKNPTADDDLFIDVSQVHTITTANFASSTLPLSVGDAILRMRVLVDGIVAKPGAIVFDSQLTALSAVLQRFISLSCVNTPTPQIIVTTSCVCRTIIGNIASSCSPVGPPPPLSVRTCTSQTTVDTDVRTTCNLVNGSPQDVDTVLSQTLGHSYDFLAPGVTGMGGTHIVQVQEMLTQFSTAGGLAQAFIGPQDVKVLAVDLKPAQ